MSCNEYPYIVLLLRVMIDILLEKTHPRNDLLCVEWDIELLTHLRVEQLSLPDFCSTRPNM